MRSAARFPLWAKGCVAALCIGLLLIQFDWAQFSSAVASFRWQIVALAALLYPLAFVLNAKKWSAALQLHHLTFTFRYLFLSGCVGFFINNFLPTAIGGDVYRIYRTSGGDSTSRAVSAVLVERLVGLSLLLLNGVVGALLLASTSALARIYLWWCAGALVTIAIVASLCVLGKDRLRRAVLGARRLRPVISNARLICRPSGAWPALLVYSLAFQLVAATAHFLAFSAVGAELSFSGALLVTVAAGLAAIVPISISGIGVIEGSIVGAAVALNVSYESALLAALLLRALSVATSAACGLVYLAEGARYSPRMLETQG